MAMRNKVQKPLAGQLATYQGDYLPHWEIGHIRVRISRTRKMVIAAVIAVGVSVVGGFAFFDAVTAAVLVACVFLIALPPGTERWQARFPPGFKVNKAWRIRFEGVVGERGHHGHLGYLHRVCEVTQVLASEPLYR